MGWRVAIAGLCVVAAPIAGCRGAVAPRAWATNPARSPSAPAASRSYAETLHWSGVTVGGKTGYYVYRDGRRVAATRGSRYVFRNLACGTSYMLRVRAHDSSGHAGSPLSVSYATPACGGRRTLGCFSAPGACGYPDPAYGNVGVTSCAALAPFSPSDLPSGSYRYSRSAHLIEIGSRITIRGYDIGSWQIQVGADDVRFDNDCLSFAGNDSSSQSAAIYTTGGASGLTVTNSTITGSDAASHSAEGLVGGGPGTVIEGDVFENASDPVTVGTGSTIANSYFLVNTTSGGAHAEAVYASNARVTLTHDTLLNQFDQTADVFMDSGASCEDHLTLTHSLLAGGGYLVYPCANSVTPGSGGMDVASDSFARCTGRRRFDSALGGRLCAGGSAPGATGGRALGAGADSHGYWPRGGFFGPIDSAYCGAGGWTWASNSWDDNGARVAC